MSSSPSSASSIAAPRGRRLWRSCLRAGVGVLVAAFGLLFAAWLIVHWGLLPRLAQWKPWMEAQASQLLGQTVQIHDIQVNSQRWVPALEMTDVRVLDGQGRPALRLGSLRATLAIEALLAFELRFSQLHVDGVQLDIRRDLKGRIRVAGMDTQGELELSDDGKAADWLFSQHEIVIRHGSVRWTDELRQAPALNLADVDLVLRNGLVSHQLRLDATPPDAWGKRLAVVGDFKNGLLDRRGDWRTWRGTLHIDLPAADVGELGQYVHLPFDLRGGRGSVRAWLDAEEGDWRSANAEIDLTDVRLRLAKHLQPLEVASFKGSVTAKRRQDGVDISASKLALTTGGGEEWPLGDVSLSWQQSKAASLTEAPGPVTAGQFKADHLDLGVMTDLATRLPLGRSLEGALKRLKLKGRVQGLELRWTGPPDEPQRWQAKGRLAGFGLPALPAPQPGAVGRPGVTGADADFEFSESGGHADLAMLKGELQFPGLFERSAIPMDDLRARLEWRVQRQGKARPAVEVRVTKAAFANADIQGDLQAVWRTGRADGTFGPGGYLPGEIDLTGHFHKVEAQRVEGYLPVAISAGVRRYIGRALKSGSLENGSFAVKGDVADFPFNRGQVGVFKLAGQVRNLQFDYLPSVGPGEPDAARVSPWPGLGQIQGELSFDRTTLTLDHAQAQLWGLQIRQLQVELDQMATSPQVRARGEARGPVADMLRFVDTTPIADWLSGATRPMNAKGVGELKLDLGIPLSHPEQGTVKGSLALNGNDLEIRPDLPPVMGARGRVDFTHQGFQVVNGTGRALGGEVSFEGGTQPDRSLRFVAQGEATADGLLKAKELGVLPGVAKGLRGQAEWRSQVTIVKGHTELTVSTDLVGMHSDWPVPLSKSASSALPVVWHSKWLGDDASTTKDEVRLDLGSMAQLRLLREGPRQPVASSGLREGVSTDFTADRSASVRAIPSETRILGGSLGLGQAASNPQPSGTLEVKGRLPKLDLTAWSQALERWPVGDPKAPMPRWHVTAQVDQLLLAQQQFTQVLVNAQQEPVTGASWQMDVRSDQLTGAINWRPPVTAAEAGRVTARLSHLSLPGPSDASVIPQQDMEQQRWPTLDLQVDQLSLRGRKLGRLELRAASKGGAVTGRDWSLEQVQLELPGGILIAEGHWTPPRASGAGRMAVNLSMNVLDSARLATHFGWADSVKGGNGLLQGSLAWSGSPTTPDIATMEGQLHLALNQGQFLRAEPGGLGRLLGILSLQALPRRLLLDFRDVFQQGFAFDQVSGDVQILRGRAKTENLRMRGLHASVFIDGSADLMKETQDLRVLIVPEVNAGAASLAYAAVNPAVGLGTFLAQLLLRDPLRAANTREFMISGPMADPRVERVERTPATPTPPRPESPALVREGVQAP